MLHAGGDGSGRDWGPLAQERPTQFAGGPVDTTKAFDQLTGCGRGSGS